MKIEKVLRKLNSSFQKTERNRHIFARILKFSDSEYRLYDLYLALYDWDKKHIGTYGTVEITDEEVGFILFWSPAKVCRIRNKLLNKNLIILIGKSTYKISILPEPPINDNPTMLKVEVAPMKEPVSYKQEKLAPLQEKEAYKAPPSLVSYKDNYVSLRSDKQYEDMWLSMGKPNNFTPDDMKFIDNSVYESMGIKP